VTTPTDLAAAKTAPAYPRLTLDVDAIADCSRRLGRRLAAAGYDLMGVTKCVDGEPSIGEAMLSAGCAGLGDSRLPALERLAAHRLGPRALIRAPQPDELDLASRVADRVLLSDPEVARILGERARGTPLEILLTVDLGDRREGVLPDDAACTARRISRLPGVTLAGISVNFACLSGQLPSAELFRQAEDVLLSLAHECSAEPLLSLGGSCCLQVIDEHRPHVRTEIRAGGGLVYGYDFVTGAAIAGLERRDPVLAAVVLECAKKPPPPPPGRSGRDAFGHVPEVDLPGDEAYYALLHLGRRDCDPRGLRPRLEGAYLAGATSDVSVLITPRPLPAGEVVSFAIEYDALVVAMTSPFVAKHFVSRTASAREGGR
jgi:predicted amino acid racemase